MASFPVGWCWVCGVTVLPLSLKSFLWLIVTGGLSVSTACSLSINTHRHSQAFFHPNKKHHDQKHYVWATYVTYNLSKKLNHNWFGQLPKESQLSHKDYAQKLQSGWSNTIQTKKYINVLFMVNILQWSNSTSKAYIHKRLERVTQGKICLFTANFLYKIREETVWQNAFFLAGWW